VGSSLGATGDGSLAPTDADSPGFWLCTSGSTGRPKLAMHRHGDLQVTADTYARSVLDVGADDVFFSVGPMFHVRARQLTHVPDGRRR
jgi:acyl-coenzyme A synthetase/AMP-(fatty) acid ligase